MRRVLPRTLLRPLQNATKPQRAVSQRYISSTVPVLDPKTPAQLPPALEKSVKSTVPLSVAWRRKEWAPHPDFSISPLADAELYDISRPTEKRMPFKMELDFDRLRLRGYFPGEAKIARTYYLDAMRLWRSRIRGQVGYYFDRETKQWTLGSRTVFFVKYHAEKNLPLSVPAALPLSDAIDLVYAQHVSFEASDLDAAKVKEALGVSPEEAVEENEAKKLIPFIDTSKLEARIAKEEKNGKTIDRSVLKESIVGHRIYLPNINIRLVRNYTPPGEAYNPYIATFRMPLGMTKTDLRSYLKSLYDLDVSFIRTAVYRGKVERSNRTLRLERERTSTHNYKRAIVGLYEPFHYPDDLDELRALGRETGRGDELYERRLKTLDDEYYIRENKKMRNKIIQRVYKRAVRYRAKGEGHLGRTVRQIMQRRKDREQRIQIEARKLRSNASLRAHGIDPDELHKAVQQE